MKDFFRKYWIWCVVGVALLLAGYWFMDTRSIQGVKQLDAAQINELVRVVGERVVLPEPLDVATVRVATVQDAEAIKKSSQFFKEAQNGDQVIIFPTKIVLFRPSQNLVVNISAPSGVQENKEEIPNPTAENTEPSQDTATQKVLTIEIRNGSGKSGLASVFKAKFNDLDMFDVAKVGNAAKDSYEKTLIINKDDHNISNLSNIVTGTVQKDLPAGETPSLADIVIILGKDAK